MLELNDFVLTGKYHVMNTDHRTAAKSGHADLLVIARGSSLTAVIRESIVAACTFI